MSKPQRRGGRPSLENAARIRDHILDIAETFFLSEGYGATSIEAIARKGGISKRTLYTRFDDKAELFAAVIHRFIGRLTERNTAHFSEGSGFTEILHQLAQRMLEAAMLPESVALQRMILAEAARFPELVRVVEKEGAREQAITRIATMLTEEAHADRLSVSNPRFAAEQFMQMVISAPLRYALLGQPMEKETLDGWAQDTVELFLQGCRKRAF